MHHPRALSLTPVAPPRPRTARVLFVALALALAACRSTNTPAAAHVVATPAASQEGAARSSAETASSEHRPVRTDPGHVGDGTPLVAHEGTQLAAFAAGCFWGVEDVFRQVPGVVATAVGYTGGRTEHPTYEAVCEHTTGHAETVLLEFDPARVSYARLLDVFFRSHNPVAAPAVEDYTGGQYRSEVFTFDEAQAGAARAAMEREAARRRARLSTRVEPIGRFWRAEEYHQQYDEKSGTHSCPVPLATTPAA